MTPSTTVRRAGVVTVSALALSLGGAFTAGAASGLTVCPSGQVLSPSLGKCVKKTVGSVTPPAPAPTTSSGSTSSSGSSSGGSIKVPLPSLPKQPQPSGGSSKSGSSGQTSRPSSGGSGFTFPTLPRPSASSSRPATGSTGITGPTIPGASVTSTASKDSGSVPGAKPGANGAGGGMLYPASAYLPSGNILGFTTLSGPGTMTIPTSSSLSSIPSPLLAGSPVA